MIAVLFAWFSVLPAFQLISGYCALNSSLALSMLLPPEVAKKMTVLPLNPYASIKVLMMVGAVYHQTGKPIYMTS